MAWETFFFFFKGERRNVEIGRAARGVRCSWEEAEFSQAPADSFFKVPRLLKDTRVQRGEGRGGFRTLGVLEGNTPHPPSLSSPLGTFRT